MSTAPLLGLMNNVYSEETLFLLADILHKTYKFEWKTLNSNRFLLITKQKVLYLHHEWNRRVYYYSFCDAFAKAEQAPQQS